MRVVGGLSPAYDDDMTNTQTLELLTWVSAHPRTYDEAMEAWGSHCPRSTAWEDTVLAGLIRVTRNRVELTPLGEAALDGRKRQPTVVV